MHAKKVKGEIEIIRIKNRFAPDSDSMTGYRDILINMRMVAYNGFVTDIMSDQDSMYYNTFCVQLIAVQVP